MSKVIEGFENLSKQELFNMSARHILSTGQQSTAGTACIYGGTGCAAAPFLLPECRAGLDKYELNWTGLRDKGLVPDHEYHFVTQLQNCHDSFAWRTAEIPFMDHWRKRMKAVATEHQLSSEVLNEPA